MCQSIKHYIISHAVLQQWHIKLIEILNRRNLGVDPNGYFIVFNLAAHKKTVQYVQPYVIY